MVAVVRVNGARLQSELRPLTDLLFIPQIYECGETRWNDIDMGNLRTRRQTYPSATFSTTNPTWTDRERTRASAVKDAWEKSPKPWHDLRKWLKVILKFIVPWNLKPSVDTTQKSHKRAYMLFYSCPCHHISQRTETNKKINGNFLTGYY
jgi:hypothetical protein